MLCNGVVGLLCYMLVKSSMQSPRHSLRACWLFCAPGPLCRPLLHRRPLLLLEIPAKVWPSGAAIARGWLFALGLVWCAWVLIGINMVLLGRSCTLVHLKICVVRYHLCVGIANYHMFWIITWRRRCMDFLFTVLAVISKLASLICILVAYNIWSLSCVLRCVFVLVIFILADIQWGLLGVSPSSLIGKVGHTSRAGRARKWGHLQLRGKKSEFAASRISILWRHRYESIANWYCWYHRYYCALFWVIQWNVGTFDRKSSDDSVRRRKCSLCGSVKWRSLSRINIYSIVSLHSLYSTISSLLALESMWFSWFVFLWINALPDITTTKVSGCHMYVLPRFVWFVLSLGHCTSISSRCYFVHHCYYYYDNCYWNCVYY